MWGAGLAEQAVSVGQGQAVKVLEMGASTDFGRAGLGFARLVLMRDQ